MTLILNEIHLLNGLKDTFQIAAADRRITRGNNIESPRKKLFAIPFLKATVSYFGLASFTKANKETYLSEWLPQFIRASSHCSSLEQFSFELSETLNNTIPLKIRKENRSGFHLSGYNNISLPEFWHFSNIPGMTGLYYNKPVEKYGVPTSDFLNRDVISHFKYDGINLNSAINGVQTYRNGELITHVMASEELDKAMGKIMEYPNFNRPTTIELYADYVKFKFEIISFIYKNWAKKKIIAKPIDVIIIKRDGLYEKKKGKWTRI